MASIPSNTSQGSLNGVELAELTSVPRAKKDLQWYRCHDKTGFCLNAFRHNPTDGSFAPPNYRSLRGAERSGAKLRFYVVLRKRYALARAREARASDPKSIFFSHGQCGADDGRGGWGQFAI